MNSETKPEHLTINLMANCITTTTTTPINASHNSSENSKDGKFIQESQLTVNCMNGEREICLCVVRVHLPVYRSNETHSSTYE